jgi:YteA family regulatory protein
VNKQQLNELKSIILTEKKGIEELLTSSDHFGMERSGIHESLDELSSYDNHPADQGSETFERGKDLALNDHEEKHLHELEEALKRMEMGTYGYCIRCHKEIPIERLYALPTAAYCIDHQVDDEVSIRRPIEEKILDPLFGQTRIDERRGQTGFDAEDAWQEVAEWGTSDTPSDMDSGRTLYYDEMYMDSDEPIGYVEPIESFVTTDIYGGAGENYEIQRNAVYKSYLARQDGLQGNAIDWDRWEELGLDDNDTQ